MQKQDHDQEPFRALRLRPVTPEDNAFLLSLFASTRSDELALIDLDADQKAAFITMQFNAQTRHYDLAYPDADHRVVLLDEAPIGRLLVDRGEREFNLVDVALLPAYRGAGIGTYLIKDLQIEAAAASKPVKLNVWHSNPAKNLYERLGFSATSNDVYCEMCWNSTS
jgi:ribosomal protein S18 acetylase RimI-like enzyme